MVDDIAPYTDELIYGVRSSRAATPTAAVGAEYTPGRDDLIRAYVSHLGEDSTFSMRRDEAERGIAALERAAVERAKAELLHIAADAVEHADEPIGRPYGPQRVARIVSRLRRAADSRGAGIASGARRAT